MKLLVVTNDGVNATTSGTYAVITDVIATVNDDNDPVFEVTAYVDGEKVVYLTTNAYFVADNSATTVAAIKGGYKLSDLSVNLDDVITAINNKPLTEANVKSVRAANDLITLADGSVKVLADDAVIYLQTDTNAVEVVTIDEIDADVDAKLTVGETEGDVISYVDTDATPDGEIDIVIIRKR